MYGILTSILSFDSRSLMISILLFSTARYKAVLYMYIKISLNHMILNFKFKDIILNFIKRYDFESN